MLCTLIAILAILIGGSVGADPHTSGPDLGAFGNYYECDKVFTDRMNSTVLPYLTACLRGKRWASTTAGAIPLAEAGCCSLYDLMSVYISVLDRNCTLKTGKQRPTVKVCKNKPFVVSESFCAGQPERRPMDEVCDKFVDSLTGRTSTACARRTSTPVMVLLAAIVVSIVGDVFGF